MASQPGEQVDLSSSGHSIGYLDPPKTTSIRQTPRSHGSQGGVHPMQKLRESRKRKAAAGDAEAIESIRLEQVVQRYYGGDRKREQLKQKAKADAGDQEARAWLKERGLYKRQWAKWDGVAKVEKTAVKSRKPYAMSAKADMTWEDCGRDEDAQAELGKARSGSGRPRSDTGRRFDLSTQVGSVEKTVTLSSIEHGRPRDVPEALGVPSAAKPLPACETNFDDPTAVVSGIRSSAKKLGQSVILTMDVISKMKKRSNYDLRK